MNHEYFLLFLLFIQIDTGVRVQTVKGKTIQLIDEFDLYENIPGVN